MAGEPEKQESLIGAAWRAVMKDGTIAALAREGIKDIQNAYYDAAFGHSDHSREPGSPLTPLFSDIKEARAQYASPLKSPLPSPSQIAFGRESNVEATVHGQAREADKPHAPTPSEIGKEQDQAEVEKPWTDRITERREKGGNAGNDQNEQGRERSLPEEQRERDNSRGR